MQAARQVLNFPALHPFFIPTAPLEHSQYPERPKAMIVSHSLSKCGSLGPAHEQPPVWRQKQTSSEEYLDNVLSTYLVPVLLRIYLVT